MHEGDKCFFTAPYLSIDFLYHLSSSGSWGLELIPAVTGQGPGSAVCSGANTEWQTSTYVHFNLIRITNQSAQGCQSTGRDPTQTEREEKEKLLAYLNIIQKLYLYSSLIKYLNLLFIPGFWRILLQKRNLAFQWLRPLCWKLVGLGCVAQWNTSQPCNLIWTVVAEISKKYKRLKGEHVYAVCFCLTSLLRFVWQS